MKENKPNNTENPQPDPNLNLSGEEKLDTDASKEGKKEHSPIGETESTQNKEAEELSTTELESLRKESVAAQPTTETESTEKKEAEEPPATEPQSLRKESLTTQTSIETESTEKKEVKEPPATEPEPLRKESVVTQTTAAPEATEKNETEEPDGNKTKSTLNENAEEHVTLNSDEEVPVEKVETSSTAFRQRVDTYSVKEQINVAGDYNIIHPDYKDGTKKFEDPTNSLDLSVSSRSYDIAAMPEYGEHLRSLKENRVLLISYPQKRLLEEIVQNIFEEPTFRPLEKRSLFFTGRNSNNAELYFNVLVEEKIGEKGKNQAIVVYLTNRFFLDSMYDGSQPDKEKSEVLGTYQRQISALLARKNAYIILLAYENTISQHLEEYKFSIGFSVWPVSPLKLLLCRHFDEEMSEHYQARLIAQKDQGLWGTDEQFYEAIEKYLSQGSVKLIEAIDRGDRLCQEGLTSPEAFYTSEGAITPAQILEKGDEIIRHLCFLGTYFSDLSIIEFRQLASVFLSNKKKKIKEEKRIEKKDDTVEITEEEKEIHCLEYWRENADDLLRKARLRAVRDEEGKKTIGFEEPYLSDSFKKYFEKEFPTYFTDEFHFLFYHQNIFFDLSTPDSIIENFIELYADIAFSEPKYYGEEGLLYLTLKTSNIQIEIREDHGVEEFLNQLQEQIVISNEGFSRIARIIVGMLEYPQLKIVIDNYFNRLIESGRLQRLALNVIEFLRFSPNFDKFYWFRQLIDRGAKETRENCFKSLIRLVQNSPSSKIYSHLDTLRSWRPEPGRENLSLSNYYSLCFILDYSIATINDIEPEEYGLWPTKYPLFSSLISHSSEDAVEKIQLLVEWLFAPHLEEACRKVTVVIAIEAIEFDFVIASIIEQWYQILMSGDEPHAEAKLLADLLLEKLFEVTNKKQQKMLIGKWNGLKNSLFKRMRSISGMNIPYAEKKKSKLFFKRRRDIIKKMIKEFKSHR